MRVTDNMTEDIYGNFSRKVFSSSPAVNMTEATSCSIKGLYGGTGA